MPRRQLRQAAGGGRRWPRRRSDRLSAAGFAEEAAHFFEVFVDEIFGLAAGEAEIFAHVAKRIALVVGHVLLGEAAEPDEPGKLGARIVGRRPGVEPGRSRGVGAGGKSSVRARGT